LRWCRLRRPSRASPVCSKGQGYWIADDFDAALPDDLLDLFEGRVKEPGAEEP
jgi:hypothetical protein